MSSTSGAGGCLQALLALTLVGSGLAIVGGIATQSGVAAVVVAVIMLAGWFFIARSLRKGREARAQAQLAAYQAEQHRIATEYQAEQHRQYAAYQAEQHRIAMARHAEQQRQLAEQQAEQEGQTVIRAREAAERERLAAEQAADQERRRRERWDGLLAKYGEADAHRVWTGRPWIGCTDGMLIDALGPPEDIDEKVLKTKTKHTYKYKNTGVNRYALRVYLDDGVVTGWEDKSD